MTAPPGFRKTDLIAALELGLAVSTDLYWSLKECSFQYAAAEGFKSNLSITGVESACFQAEVL